MAQDSSNRVCLVRSPSGATECMRDAGHEWPHRDFWGKEWPRDAIPNRGAERCPLSKRADDEHSWKFDGDDPRIVCVYCGEIRDALSGAVIAKRLDPIAPIRDEGRMFADATRNRVEREAHDVIDQALAEDPVPTADLIVLRLREAGFDV